MGPFVMVLEKQNRPKSEKRDQAWRGWQRELFGTQPTNTSPDTAH